MEYAILEDSYNYYRKLLKESVEALSMLWHWTKAEIEHFEGATPDDFIVEKVEAVLAKFPEVK